MAKQLNVNLAFNADTSKAKAQIQELYQSLNNVSTTTAKLPITTQIQEAQNAAIQLKTAMNSAFDVNTGKLDLLKFNQSIKASGTSLQEIRNRLVSIGPAGQQAFLSLAQSIAAAEIPAKRTSALLTNLGVTLKNTVKWQLSSSMLHGFMGAIQSAYGYAQNLNSSLNDIRIVTGQSAEEMDRFAARANKAAKSLSASTLDYTNASLIYYQQGLNDQQVKERTDVTVKMANVTGKTAQEISQQMTAVWNNFDDGSKSLEYYADVMTALGAATASSTDEIAQGLQKFSAVAETVGLSYEYATAALATITATTRESADVVGTALKTLFARIQGLKLGETLEDGVDLNKYSEALAKVGISVFEQNGELKDMDNILNEMADKWETLSGAQQTALAQTVAGVRQYTHLVALMENWDFMESNLDVAYGATGTLNEQADIYAESWEAASKRVKAAAEAIYTDLLNDKFFIGLTNTIEKVLTMFDGFLDSIGGARGVLLGLSSILLNAFSGQAAKGLENMVYNFKSFVGIAQKEAIATQNATMVLAQQNGSTSGTNGVPVTTSTTQSSATSQDATAVTAATSAMQSQLQLTHAIAQQKEQMSAAQQQEAQALLEQNRIYGDQAILLAQKAEASRGSHQLLKDELIDLSANATETSQILSSIDDNIEFGEKINQEVKEAMDAFTEGKLEVDAYVNKINELAKTAKNKGLNATASKLHGIGGLTRANLQDMGAAERRRHQNEAYTTARRETRQQAQDKLGKQNLSTEQVDKYISSQRQVVTTTNAANEAIKRQGEHAENSSQRIKGFVASTTDISGSMVKAAQAASSLMFALNSIINIGNIWSNENLTGGQKLLQTMTALATAVPMLMNAFAGFKTVFTTIAGSQAVLNAISMQYASIVAQSTGAITAETLAKQTGLSIDQAKIALAGAESVAALTKLNLTKESAAAYTAESLAQAANITVEQAGIILDQLAAGATLQAAMAEAGLTSSLWAQVVAWISLHTAMSPVLVVVLLIAAALATVALAVWGFVAAWKAAQAATPEGQLKAAKEEAQALAEELQKAKDAAEELKSAFDGYDSAVSKLEECTEGTQEWREALQDVNNEVLDLMAKYPQLATMNKDGVSAITRDKETGALQIADWAKEELIQQADKAVLNAQTASIQANQNVREKQLIVDAQDIAKDLNRLEGTTATRASTDEEKADGYGETIDVSAEVAKYISQNPELFTGTNEERRANLEAYQKQTGYQINIDSWLSAINQMGPSLNGLISAVEANTAATQAENEILTEQILADNQAIQNSKYSSELISMAATDLDEAYETELAAMDRWGKDGLAQIDGVNQVAKDIFEEYAAAAGISNYDLLDTTGNDENRKFVYRDTTTNQEVTVSLEAMRSVVAASRANEKIAENASGLLEVLSDKTEEEVGLITGVITKNSDYFKVGQTDFSDKIDNSEISEDFTLEDLADEIEDKTGLDIEDLKKLGYEGTDEEILTKFRDDYNAEIDNARKQTRQIIGDQVSIVNQELNKLKTDGLLDNLSIGELAELGNILTEALISGGKEGVDLISSMYSEADAQGKGSEFLQLMSSIDWDNITLEDLQDQVYDLGLNSVLTSEQMSQLITAMQDVSTSAGEAISQIAKLAEILGDLKLGDTISAEAYKELEDMGLNVDQYFLKMADGSYQLIADATEFYNTVKQGMQETAVAAIEEKQAENTAIGDENSGWIQWLNNNENGFAEYSQFSGKDNSFDKSGLFDITRNAWGVMTGSQITEQGTAQAQNQLDFLKLAGYDEAKIANWQAKLDDGSLDPQTFTDMTNAANDWIESMGGASGAAEYFNNKIQENNEEISDSQEMLASTADNLSELYTMERNGAITAEQANKATRSIVLKEATAEGFDTKEIDDYAEALMNAYDATVETEEEAYRLALAHKRQQKGLDALAAGYEDWFKKMKSNGPDAVEALAEMKDTMADILDFSDEDMQFLDQEFFLENEQLIKDAATKGGEYIDQLREKASDEIIAKVTADLDETKAAEITGQLQNLRTQAQLTLDGNPVTIGTTIDNTAAFDGLQALLDQGIMTADEMNAYLASIGYDPVIEYDEMSLDDYIANGGQHTQNLQYFDENGKVVNATLSTVSDYKSAGATMVRIPRIRGEKTTYRGSGSGTSSKPKPSGGGGGGGGKTPKHAEKKNDSDKTRYHTLQNQLEDLKSEYEEIAEASDRAFGKDKLKGIDDEIEKTQELIDKQKEYVKAISSDLPKDKAIMDQYYTSLIGGKIKYDEKGNIANFDEIQDAMYKKYNEMTERYDEESEEWKVFEKKYEQLEKYIEQYEETYDLLRDEESEYQELLNQRLDLELKKIQYAIELKLNIAEDSLDLLNYQMSRIEDDAFKAAEAVGMFADKAELLYDQMAADREGLNDILGQSLTAAEIKAFYSGDLSVLKDGTFTEEQIDAIKEYRDNLLELNEEFDEIRESVEEQLMEVFDAWNEKLEEGIESLEHYGSVLESYRNIIDIVGEDGLGISEEFMKNLNEAQIGNAIDKVNATRDAYEAMMKAQQEAEKALEEAKNRGDEASIKMWTENLAELTNEANDAQEEFLSAWEDALDTVAEQFEMTVERVIKSFNESIYALGGLEGLSEEFSRQQETADMIVDDYQKIYELSKLNRDIQRTLDDTDVIAGKQKLLKLQEKINDLEAEGVEMSQYDLEYLQAEYELRMAEIELENAQKAKDTVRMSRDNEGNWSYVYTTNTDAVDAAQQKYEDALYAMQDLSSNYIDEMSEKLISTSQEMEEALASLRIQDFASIDDYYAEVERIKKEYGEQLALEQAELQKAIDNNKVLYDEDMTNYAKATGEKYRLAEEFITSFKDSLLGSIMDSESESANFTDIIGSAVNDLTTGLMEAATTYYQNLEAAMNAADTSTGDFAEDTAANIDAVVEKSKEGAEAIDQMAIEMTEAFAGITEQIVQWQETYGTAMEKIIQSNLDVINSFNNMLEALSIDADKINVSYDINTSPAKDNPAAFDTGGYTGAWGDIGKLAVLHEKELILNENDTSNFLKAINISKVILDMIETNAKYASMGLGQITPTVIKEEPQEILEQMVHITAEFPGVQDRNEIEEAFKTLVNTASQYANRK